MSKYNERLNITKFKEHIIFLLSKLDINFVFIFHTFINNYMNFVYLIIGNFTKYILIQ